MNTITICGSLIATWPQLHKGRVLAVNGSRFHYMVDAIPPGSNISNHYIRPHFRPPVSVYPAIPPCSGPPADEQLDQLSIVILYPHPLIGCIMACNKIWCFGNLRFCTSRSISKLTLFVQQRVASQGTNKGHILILFSSEVTTRFTWCSSLDFVAIKSCHSIMTSFVESKPQLSTCSAVKDNLEITPKSIRLVPSHKRAPPNLGDKPMVSILVNA